jgi:hypothetical protein
MRYAIMFNILQGGDIEPVKWSKDEFKSDRSIIVLEEMTPAVWLWHGNKQNLIARRVASRQAEALKGYGYDSGGTIIGSRTRIMKEIDERKLTIDPLMDELNVEFQKLLNTKFEPLDEFVVIVQSAETLVKPLLIKTKTAPEMTSQLEPEPLTSGIKKPTTLKEPKEVSGETMSDETIEKVEEQNLLKKLKTPEEPFKHIKKTEYGFEPFVQEIKSPESKLREEKIVEMTEIIKNQNIIKDMLQRIEKLEERLNLLDKDFQDSLKKNKNS